MQISWDAIEYVLLTLFFGSVGGAISGAFIADFFANRRGRRRRKIEFLAFLNAWAADFRANRPKYIPAANLSRGVFDLFDDFRIELIVRSTAVELDHSRSRQPTYKDRVAKIIEMTPGQLSTQDNREKLDTALGALIDFLKTN